MAKRTTRATRSRSTRPAAVHEQAKSNPAAVVAATTAAAEFAVTVIPKAELVNPEDEFRLDASVNKRDVALLLKRRRKKQLEAAIHGNEANRQEMIRRRDLLKDKILADAGRAAFRPYKLAAEEVQRAMDRLVGAPHELSCELFFNWRPLDPQKAKPAAERVEDHKLELTLRSSEKQPSQYGNSVYLGSFPYDPSADVLGLLDEHDKIMLDVRERETQIRHLQSQLNNIHEFGEDIEAAMVERAAANNTVASEFLDHLAAQLDQAHPVSAVLALPAPTDDAS